MNVFIFLKKQNSILFFTTTSLAIEFPKNIRSSNSVLACQKYKFCSENT